MIGLRHPHVGSIGPEKPGMVHTVRQLDGVQIVAYCEDTEPSLLEPARQHDPCAHVYTSVDDLISREDFDLAFVLLPANEIPAVCIKLARAGKHFFMEKQFGRSSADLAELVRTVRDNGVKVLPGYMFRFHPAMQELRRIIGEGKLGKPISVESRMCVNQVRPGIRDPGSFLYLDNTEGGGILHMLACHLVDLMGFQMGSEVKYVQAMVGRPVGHIEEPLEDLAIAVFEYENGAHGSIHAGYTNPGLGEAYDSCLIYRGVEGWASWLPHTAPHKLQVASTSPEWSGSHVRTFDYDVETYTGYMGVVWYLEMLQGLITAIQEDLEPAETVEDALHVLQCIEAVYESAQTGRRVEVKSGA